MRLVLTVLVVALVLPSLSEAQDCIDYGDYLHWMGSVDLAITGLGVGLSVSGSYAYCALGNELQIIDISAPQNPVVVGIVNLPMAAWDVAVSGSHAFVAVRYSGLQVIDITNPHDPQVVGSLDIPDPLCMVVSDMYAYVGAGAPVGTVGSLYVIDIMDPQCPQIIGSVDVLESFFWCAAISGNYVYLLAEEYLYVIDIADPQSPQIVSNVDMPPAALGVAVSDGYAYVTGYFGLLVIDVTNSLDPQIVGSVEVQGLPWWDVSIAGHCAYVAAGDYGLQVFDISIPNNPIIVGMLMTPRSARCITVEDNHAFVIDVRDIAACSSALHVINISNPESPPLLGMVNTASGWYGTAGIAIREKYAYVAAPDSGLQVINIANTENPQIIDTVGIPDATGITISGDFAYVAGNDLTVIEITNPASPQIIGSVDTPGYGSGVAVAGNYVYLKDHDYASQYSALLVIDIYAPESPQIVGAIDTPGVVTQPAIFGIRNVTVAGNYVYLADWNSGLQVIDVSDPTNPLIVGNVATSRRAQSVVVSGEYAYVVDARPVFLFGEYDGNLYSIDITDPVSPNIVGSICLPGQPWGLTVCGSVAYVISQSCGLYVTDITEPQDLSIIGCNNTLGRVRDVAVSGGKVYVTFHAHPSRDSGVEILPAQCEEAVAVSIDIKPSSDNNPVNCRAGDAIIPVAIKTTTLFDALTVDHATVRFGSDSATEVHQNPHGPIRHEEDVEGDGDIDLMFHFRFGETGIQCGDNEATLTGMTYDGQAFSGTDQIRTISGERNEEILALAPQISPNPFNPQTTISFAVDRLQQVRIAVYDLVGREVAVLADQGYKPGAYTLTWEGTDMSGRAVSSGTYIVRLETDSRVEARKVMLLR